ncbi:hypothetical protein LTR08_008138 [Meristemomyces frigidus]|nr:hypothetical protein LTR08_008138 [Meristemomyces frigidus]
MAKEKEKKKGGVPNKHLHARIAYLQRAATYLTMQSQGRPVQPLGGEYTAISVPALANESPELTGNLLADQTSKPAHEDSETTTAPVQNDASTFTDHQAQHPTSSHAGRGLPLHLSSHLRQVALKAQIRLHADIKHSICKVCSTVLIEGQTCTKVTENLSRGGKKVHAGVVVLRCGGCGATKRFPVGARRQVGKGKRGQAGRERKGDATFEAAKAASTHLISGLKHVTWNPLPEPVQANISAPPKATALQTILGVVAFVPGLAMSPVFGALGFTGIGPAAVSAAE